MWQDFLYAALSTWWPNYNYFFCKCYNFIFFFHLQTAKMKAEARLEALRVAGSEYCLNDSFFLFCYIILLLFTPAEDFMSIAWHTSQ